MGRKRVLIKILEEIRLLMHKQHEQAHVIYKYIGSTIINIQRYESNTNEILISATTSIIEQMKYGIAFELGVTLGPDTSSSVNGSIGGEITKRLVRMAEKQLTGQYRLH